MKVLAAAALSASEESGPREAAVESGGAGGQSCGAVEGVYGWRVFWDGDVLILPV